MTVEILDKVEDDLVHGFQFYETQQRGLGSYFLKSLLADMESLQIHGGVHRIVYRNYHRALAKRFPFAIFYTVRSTPYPFMQVLIADANRHGSPNT